MALVLFTVASCMAMQPVPLAKTAARYDPVILASGIPATPGSLAWSPDGKRLALTGKTLTILDIDSGRKESFPANNPYYAAWASDGTLYALSVNAENKSLLCSLADGNPRLKETVLDGRIDAVYPTSDRKLVFRSVHSKRYSFGTEISAEAVQQDLATGNSKTLYSFSRTCVVEQPDISQWTSLMHAGLNPLEDTLLVMEHIKPPHQPLYARVKAINVTTGESSNISDPDNRKPYISACWSPDGKRAALADRDGRIEIRNRFGRGSALDASPLGIFPSWNPKGSSIYAGGYLIDSNGLNKEVLLENASASIGAWSPDGSMLAVVVNGRLVLFRHMQPSYIAPDGPLDPALRERLSVLDRLRADNLISENAYKAQQKMLLLGSGEGK